MTPRRKQGLTDNRRTVELRQENEMDAASPQHLCSDAEAIILPPRILQERKIALKLAFEMLGK